MVARPVLLAIRASLRYHPSIGRNGDGRDRKEEAMRIDRDNPLNRVESMLPETVAAAIAADWHGADADALRTVLALCRDDVSARVPMHGMEVSASQLADAIRHEVSRQLAERRRESQLDGMADRIAAAFPRVSRRWDRRMRQNGDARRSSVVVLS